MQKLHLSQQKLLAIFFLFSKEIADSYSIQLATLPQKDCKYILKNPLKTFQIFSVRKFGIADR